MSQTRSSKKWELETLPQSSKTLSNTFRLPNLVLSMEEVVDTKIKVKF